MLEKSALASLFILLVWGNMVSGLQAGLACPDWPLCHGEFLPPYRWDIYMEFLHRVIGAITSVLIITLCIRRFRAYTSGYRTIPVLTVLLLAIQIFLGGIVVLLELPVDLTTTHFGNAMIIYALVFFQAYHDGYNRKPALDLKGINLFLVPLTVLILIQTVLGAYVRHSDAGMACPDFPKCMGYWIPPELSGTLLTHFSHRMLAYVIILLSLFLFLYQKLNGRLHYIKKSINLIILLLILQVAVGASVVLMQLTFYMAAIHLSFAILIFSLSLLAVFSTTQQQQKI